MMMLFWGVALISALVTLALIDWRTYRLPNAITAPLIGAGLLFAHFGAQDLRSGVIGAALGYGALVALELAYKSLRGRAGLGRGDAKLLAAGGAWCGWMGLSFIVLIASGSALLLLLLPSLRARAQTDKKLPFGPFLALGIALVWTAQNIIA